MYISSAVALESTMQIHDREAIVLVMRLEEKIQGHNWKKNSLKNLYFAINIQIIQCSIISQIHFIIYRKQTFVWNLYEVFYYKS